jgi:hypothetical protein
MIKWPTKLTGASPITRWLNQHLAASKASNLIEGPDYYLQEKPTGKQIRFKTGGGSGAPNHDFILCRNGEQIRVKLLSDADPTTVEPDTGTDEETPP